MNNQRLGYQRLAEALVQRGLVESRAVEDALAAEGEGGPLFPDALIEANLVADWELSHLVCQLYSLPFLNVDMAEPDPEAQKGLDLDFLWETGVIPLARHGQVLTLCMPAIVPAETLGYIAASTDLLVVVVVGTVVSNRRWILNNTRVKQESNQISSLSGASLEEDEEGGDWSNLFDEADAAVLQDLDAIESLDPSSPEMDLSSLEGEDHELEFQALDAEEGEEDEQEDKKMQPQSASSIDLPPPLPRKTDPESDEETIL